jgi:hypothetical protein
MSAAVNDYKIFEVGGDCSDKLIAYYTFYWCQVKWWKKLHKHLTDLAPVNVLILHKSIPHKLRL